MSVGLSVKEKNIPTLVLKPCAPLAYHSDSCTPPAFTVLGVGIECVKYISHTRSQTLCAKGVSRFFSHSHFKLTLCAKGASPPAFTVWSLGLSVKEEIIPTLPLKPCAPLAYHAGFFSSEKSLRRRRRTLRLEREILF